MKRITIIGGGASGTLVAVNLLQNVNGRPLEINLVERQNRIGRGVAFGTVHDTHLLNVPAAKMGAFPDDIEHFHKWLTEKGHAFGPNDFVPRKIFGEYLKEVLLNMADSATEHVRFNLIDDEAIDLVVDGSSANLSLRSGKTLNSDHVVLAFGNFQPPKPNVRDLDFLTAPKYFSDPWSQQLYETVDPSDSIFIIGTGLSMIDVVLHLHKQKHRGQIVAISTRGLLPAVHELGHTYPPFNDELKSLRRITDILKVVRRHIKKAEKNGSNWRAVIDSLRPATQSLWMDLPTAEKRYFMQHLSRYWNVARHRMPPEAAAILNEMSADGKLEVLKGRLKSIDYHSNNKFEIIYTNEQRDHHVTADTLVNCIGSESDFSKIDSQLVRSLMDNGHIRNDELSKGIAASPDGSVIGRHGEYSSIIFTLGTALKGTLWETTAIPEIRSQAKLLAIKLLDD